VHLTLGKEVVELAVVDVTKGVALTLLRDRLGLPFGTGGVLYIGDDVTDERAFAVLDDDSGDVTIKVGPGETLARHRLEGPEDVAITLEYLAARLGPV
jgi:trehalose 6-phosphate phosphatase